MALTEDYGNCLPLALSMTAFWNPKQSIIAEVYYQHLDEMHMQLSKIQLALINLFHENAWPHIAMITLQELTDLGYEILLCPLCSSDLWPTEKHFLKNILTIFSAKRYSIAKKMQKQHSNITLRPAPLEFCRRGINKNATRWEKCIDFQFPYFD